MNWFTSLVVYPGGGGREISNTGVCPGGGRQGE